MKRTDQDNLPVDSREAKRDKDVDVEKYRETYIEFNEKWLQEQHISIDWIVEERNKHWHDTYFTKRAVKLHQAKGNCRFVTLCIEELERLTWLNKGDVILDPMCGIGSFLMVAALRGYDGVGIELEEKFCKEMLGYMEYIEIEDETDLFSDYMNNQHVEGNIEKFHRLTNNISSVGNIGIINGDARETHSILHDSSLYTMMSGDQKLVSILSPPYGNRLSDVLQTAGANDGRTWKEIDEESADRRQYSNDKANIGTNKIVVVSSPPYSGSTEIGGKAKNGNLARATNAKHDVYDEDNIARRKLVIVSSPPYSRSTEHSGDQIDALPDGKVGGHKGFAYGDRENIALLGIGPYDIEMLKVYQSLHKALGARSSVVLLTRNFIQKGKIVLLDELTVKLMEQAGFKYHFTRRAELPEISMFKYMNWNNTHREKGLPLITWEEATFYTKE